MAHLMGSTESLLGTKSGSRRPFNQDLNMHHISPKGDQLCPLGFHPQVRWPTRCKRCFRDYKEHGNKKNGNDIAASSPSISLALARENREDALKPQPRSWTSSTNLSTSNSDNVIPKQRPSSWTSTPDLDEISKDHTKPDISVSISLPKRRHTAHIDLTSVEEAASITIKRPPLPNKELLKEKEKEKEEKEKEIVIYKTDSLAERVRKMQLIKRQGSIERDSSKEKTIPKKLEREEPKKPPLPPPVEKRKEQPSPRSYSKPEHDAGSSNYQDVQFLIQVKNKSPKNFNEDTLSTCTETTDTTINNRNDPELLEHIESLKRELDMVKQRCERAERDKSDILLRRLASLDTVPNKTAASEALKLQQKVNDLTQQNEEYRDDKKFLSLRVRELEQDLQSRPERNIEEQLRSKLQAAEALCEELMDENEDMKREIRNMESEMDEMQDSFREDQADEYTTMKKELEQTTKNCRILSFKLKKSERKIDQLETDKPSQQTSSDLLNKIKELEEELKAAHEVSRRLQSEAELAEKNSSKKKAPTLGILGKSTSADNKYSRDSITRGGSQDDPVKLMRDLQDSLEREADLREQLKFAEEEGENLRKKSSRVDDENESLMMQLKKMATKARSRKLSPANRLSTNQIVEKDEGISDEEDPAELRVLLELNEQEATILRRKVEELEVENESIKKQISDLQEKFNRDDKSGSKKLPSFLTKSSSSTGNDKKIKTLEEEVSELKKKLTEKDKLVSKLQIESKSNLKATKSKLVDFGEQQSVDVKRQLQVIEQEATILRTKLTNLEQENDKLSTENKKLSLQAARAGRNTPSTDSGELIKAKEALSKMEKEKNELNEKLIRILEEPVEKLPPRIPKKFIETSTKLQFKKTIEELEAEIIEMRAIVLRTGANKLQDIEKEKNSIEIKLKESQEKFIAAGVEIKHLKSKQEHLSSKATKLLETETKLKKTETENSKLNDKIKQFEEKISKLEITQKQIEKTKSDLEQQTKTLNEQKSKFEKEIEKEKKDKHKLESKITDLEKEQQNLKEKSDKTKKDLEKEISNLKKLSSSVGDKKSQNEDSSKKIQDLNEKIIELETNIQNEAKKYADITGKYEILEEEHVLTKAQLTTEKEKLGNEINSIKSQLATSTSEENKLKRDNTELKKTLNELQQKLEQNDIHLHTSIEMERNRLKENYMDKERELEKMKSQNEMNSDVISQLKKENDETKRKLDDFDRVTKVQRTLNEHNNSLEQELKKMQMKLENAEHSVKSEVASTRLRYEHQVSNLQSELTSLQRQCERFKRDRDAFKQLLEGAQKSMSEMKQSSGRNSRTSNTSGDDETKVLVLEQQIGCLEDELSEARLDASKLKTELVSEKSAFEIKISEMQSKMNEYEEERLLGSGRTKIPGMKTRLELSWQKEREELTKLVQETSTLARDLRQTLFEVERERDKDRLESKRKLEQLKKATEEEMEEGRKKISELQCDLLELRDAHAKLRTANEKLRRERERYERERDTAAKRRMEQDGDRKVGALLQTVEEFVKIAPELQLVQSSTNSEAPSVINLKIPSNNNTLHTPNKPRRSKSPSPGPTGPQSLQISGILSRLAEAYEELKKYQKLSDDDKERERFRRGSMRRAASTENDEGGGTPGRTRGSRMHNGNLYRKSLSLDQSIHQDQLIWKQDDGSMSSIQSIDSDFSAYMGMGRESSMDSRLSTGSTQSDMPRGPRKKKRGLMGKLRSLTKSRGTESDGGSIRGSDSDLSISGDHKSSKRDLKERLSGMFRRSGSRQNSTETLDSSRRPVAVTVTTIENGPRPSSSTSNPGTPNLKRNTTKPPPSSTPNSQRKSKK